jgi:tRNA(Ile2) C34 agmatinyltransferase TiaS
MTVLHVRQQKTKLPTCHECMTRLYSQTNGWWCISCQEFRPGVRLHITTYSIRGPHDFDKVIYS